MTPCPLESGLTVRKQLSVALTAFQGSFTALLSQSHLTNRFSSSEVMHAVFSAPRGSKTSFDPDKLDAIHALLQQQPGEALLNQAHPVGREWELWDPVLGSG
jgi:hypothetical protein